MPETSSSKLDSCLPFKAKSSDLEKSLLFLPILKHRRMFVVTFAKVASAFSFLGNS